VELCRRAGFRKVRLRGDTAFSQTTHLDRWHKDGVEFVFGYDAAPNLVKKAENLEECAWTPLTRKRKAMGALSAPLHDLTSNWAYMVIRAIAYSDGLKSSQNTFKFIQIPSGSESFPSNVVFDRSVGLQNGECESSKTEIISGPFLLRIRLRSSANVSSSVWCKVFSVLQCSRRWRACERTRGARLLMK